MTEALANALGAARRISRSRSADYVGTEHLLAGLLEGETSTAREVLRRLGVDAASLARATADLAESPSPRGPIVLPPETDPSKVEFPYSQKAHVAYRAALASRDDFGGVVGTGQLLIALLDPEFVSGAVAATFGIKVEAAREALRTSYETDELAFRSDAWAAPLVRVDQLREDQWRVWRELRLKALSMDPSAFGMTLDVASKKADADWIQDAATKDGDFPLIVYLDGVAAGMCFVKVEGIVARLYAMWVDVAYRGRGCGSALVDRALEIAHKHGCNSVELRVTASNAAAVGLYRSRGFRETGETSPLRAGSDVETKTMVLQIE